MEDAHLLGCETVQIFSKSPRTGAASPLNDETLESFKNLRRKYSIAPLAVHASYLINLASPNSYLRKKSIEALVEELERAQSYGADYLVAHVGSSSSESDRERVLRRVATAARQALKNGFLA